MLKFFRKYNMIILVVGGCFLMVAFLVGSSIQQLQGLMNNSTYATMRGENVSANQYANSQREYVMVKRMLEPVFPAFIMALEGQDNSGGESWFLLSHEAASLGLVGGVQDGQNMMSLAADMAADTVIADQFGGVSPQLLENEQIRQMYDAIRDSAVQVMEQQRQAILAGSVNERSLDLALAKAHGVLRLFTTYRNQAALVSYPELRSQAEDVLDIAVIGMVTIPARVAADDLPDPSESEIQEQFETYKSVRPGEGLLGFGYLRPPAVQVEWINIDHMIVGENLPLDPVDVRVFYTKNKNLRGWGDDFAEAKVSVEDYLRTEKATEVVAAGVEAGRNEMRRLSSPLEDDGAFKAVPSDWRDRFGSMEVVADRVREAMNREAGVDVSESVSVMSSNGEWTSSRQAMLLPGVGRSIEPIAGGRAWVSFGELALQVRGLVDDEQARVQEGLIYGPLTAGDNRYFFRVTDYRQESPPESLDEVREKVVSDTKLLRGWNQLNDVVMDEAHRLADAEGLEAVAREYGMSVQQPVEVSRVGMTSKAKTPQPIRGENQPELRDAIMDIVSPWDPLAEVSSIPADQRTLAMPIEEAKGLVVVMVTGRYPVTRERLLESYSLVENAFIRQFTEELTDNMKTLSDTERLRERFEFELVKKRRGVDDFDDDEGFDDDAGVDPSLEALN